MSQGEKLFERPKVRFSQPSEDSSTNSEIHEKPFHSNTANKPRIRSIVTLDEPYKVIYKNGDIPSTSKGNVDNTVTLCSSHAQTSTDKNFPKTLSSSQHNVNSKAANSSLDVLKTSPCINDPQNKPQKDNFGTDTMGRSSVVLNDAKKSRPLLVNSNSRSSQRNSSTAVEVESKNSAQIKTGAIPKAGNSTAAKIGSKHSASLKTVSLTVKKTGKKMASLSNDNVAIPKNPVSRNTVSKISRQREKTTAKGGAAVRCLSRNVTTAKTVPCGLKVSKPGSKTWKTRPKSSPVKKTIMRDVTGQPTNVYVGPGVARYYSQPFKISTEKEKPHIRPDIVSGEKLSRPEYNSIMCTIEELKKVQAEKFVTDVEHLPSAYRNLVNEKVSAALDFPPDEAIYKNLVDLSVNDNQLPLRVTRSKDPEPRHKDIVPKLSDFFTPTYSEEYCAAVQIRPNSPEIFSNWSAFAISDKIFGWKHDMDQCY